MTPWPVSQTPPPFPLSLPFTSHLRLSSCGLGRELERAGCVRHRRGAAGPRAPRAPLSSQEDQAGGHDQALLAGKGFQLKAVLGGSLAPLRR